MNEVTLGPAPRDLLVDGPTVDFVKHLSLPDTLQAVQWVVSPMLLHAFGSPSVSPTFKGLPYLKSLGAVAPLSRGLSFRLQGEALFANHAGNPARTLDSIIRWREAHGSPPSVHVTPRRVATPAMVRWLRTAYECGEAIISAASASGLAVDRAHVHRLAAAAARSIGRSEAVLGSTRARTVVVATQHAIDVRAALLVARRHGLPTVYFPHAPVETTPKYCDLPVSHAGLRGPAEADYYREVGARGDVRVVGNPAVDLPSSALITIDDDIPPVMAVPPYSEDAVRQLVNLVESAVDGPVLVAPHPRTDVGRLESLCPASWHIWKAGPTIGLLQRGPSCVIQHSSGLAWECLSLGIPAVQLTFEGERPAYPIIREPEMLFADSTSSLRAALEGARVLAASTTARLGMVRWADWWCARSGEDAAQLAAELIAVSIEARRPIPPILDQWS